MIYIDFYGGTHGNFLRFLINRFVLVLDEYQDFLPFNSSGVSHLLPPSSTTNNIVLANHYSMYELTQSDNKITLKEEDRLLHINDSDLLIRIHVNFEKHSFIWFYNMFYRAMPIGHNLDLKTTNDEDRFLITKSPLAQGHISYCKSNRKCLRNVFYSLFLDPNLFFNIPEYYTSYHGFKKPKIKNFLDISIDTLFDYNSLYNFLLEIAKNQNCNHHNVNDPMLYKVWRTFINRSGGFYKKTQVDHFFQNILSDTTNKKIVKFNLMQESYLNFLITKNLDIHKNIHTFEEEKLTLSSELISQEIKNIMHCQNSNFKLTAPINQQIKVII